MKTGNPAPLGVNFSKPWEQSVCAICALLFKFHIVCRSYYGMVLSLFAPESNKRTVELYTFLQKSLEV